MFRNWDMKTTSSLSYLGCRLHTGYKYLNHLLETDDNYLKRYYTKSTLLLLGQAYNFLNI